MACIPSFVSMHRDGRLAAAAERLYSLMDRCGLCPRRCKVNRRTGEAGVCGASAQLVVASAFAHFGEEPPLTGLFGSGTVFLAHCPLRCVFCQNYDISHGGAGEPVTAADLAEIMLELQRRGCHNINFVTPTHYAPQIVESLDIAAAKGLELPVVWNCGGYESVEALRLLEGVVDIYMPDVKFFSKQSSKKYCKAPDYPETIKAVLKEMRRQVGDLTLDSRGIARKGLLIRHLVMPDGGADTEEILKFVADEISPDSYVNIMDQYHPLYHAHEFPEINRATSAEEYDAAIAAARRYGLHRGF